MISYDRLWITLVKKHLKKTDLKILCGISGATLAKLGKNESVSLKTIESICIALNCSIEDVFEIKPN